MTLFVTLTIKIIFLLFVFDENYKIIKKKHLNCFSSLNLAFALVTFTIFYMSKSVKTKKILSREQTQEIAINYNRVHLCFSYSTRFLKVSVLEFFFKKKYLKKRFK